MSFDPIIFITARDRFTDLARLIDWLERAGHERITILDNDSTYPPLLDYYDRTDHTVVRLGKNLGAWALWHAELVPDDWFVLTDPDLLPIDECPHDLVTHLRDVMDRHGWAKAGPGLFLEDVPIMGFMEWERSLVSDDKQLAPGVFASLIDTTFALHRPRTEFSYHAIRCDRPYQVRHLPWYRWSQPNEEDRYYLDRARGGPGFATWKTAAG